LYRRLGLGSCTRILLGFVAIADTVRTPMTAGSGASSPDHTSTTPFRRPLGAAEMNEPATLIDREADTDHAAGQLGHKSKEITRKHYVVKAPLAPDNSAILEKLGR
jgi:hypothetical protein